MAYDTRPPWEPCAAGLDPTPLGWEAKLKTKIYVVALLAPTRLKFIPNMVKIVVSYKLLMGFWLGIGASTIWSEAMKGEHWLLIIDEPVDSQALKEIIDHFKGV